MFFFPAQGRSAFSAVDVGSSCWRAKPGPRIAKGRCSAFSKELAPFQGFQVANPKSEGISRQITLKFFHWDWQIPSKSACALLVV